MDKDFVTFYQFQDSPSKLWIEDKTKFTLRKDKKYYWLQRICFWILNKLGCYDSILKTQTTRLTVTKQHSEKFLDVVLKTIKNQRSLYHLWQNKQLEMAVGPDFFYEIIGQMSDAEYNQYIMLDCPKARMGYNQEIDLIGVRIYVCPWMSGWLLLPKR